MSRRLGDWDLITRQRKGRRHVGSGRFLRGPRHSIFIHPIAYGRTSSGLDGGGGEEFP